MTTFAFTVIVDGLDLDDGSRLDHLDTDEFIVLPSGIDGITTIDVEIDATSGEDALRRLLDHLRGTGVEVTRLLDDLVNVPEIADRLGVNRETVRTWVNGSRGGADFPRHRQLVGNQKIWPWSQVFAWAQVRGRLPADAPAPLDSSCVDWFNGTLVPTSHVRVRSNPA